MTITADRGRCVPAVACEKSLRRNVRKFRAYRPGTAPTLARVSRRKIGRLIMVPAYGCLVKVVTALHGHGRMVFR